MPFNPGEVIDNKYEIIERLGAGGMGEVYKVAHTYLGATRVIKVVHPQISSNEDARSRFLREARAATKVQHPNVATLHDFSGLPDGSHYMVWEYIDGENLAQRLRARGRLAPREAVQIAIQTLRGLEAIHRAGIIHRDVSPENLMITHEGSMVKIIDLGVAKLEDPSEVSATRTGIFVGKLRYASPEQLGFIPDGERIDARTDLYSVGMVLYELLMGRPPYEAKSPHEYFLIHARDEQQNKRSVELPMDMPGGQALRQVLDRALERDRNRRWSNAAELAAALEQVGRTITDHHDLPTIAQRPPKTTAEPVTVRTPMPMAAPPKPQRTRSVMPLLVVAGLVVLAVAAVLLWPRKPEVVETTIAQSTRPAPPQIVESSVTVTESAAAPAAPIVVTTTTTEPAPRIAVPTTTTQARAEEPKREPVREPEPEPAAAPAPTPASAPVQEAPANIRAYVDGGEDEATNDRMIERLRQELEGVRRVELHGGAMQAELTKAMKEYFPTLEIADGAPVVIRFEGILERLGRGRKKRAANATITKNGRVIFRYHLPEEVFRVGMHPPHAFARVLSDALILE